MEGTLFLGILFAPVLLVIIVVLTPLVPFLNTLHASDFLSGIFLAFFSLHALCSVLWGLRFRFSYQQFKLLAKYILLFNGGISAAFIGFFHLGFGMMFPPLFELLIESGLVSSRYSASRWAGIAIFFTFWVPFMGLLGLLKKTVGERVSGWLRIKYVPDTVSLDQAFNLLARAERELKRQNYEGAGEAFHHAATIYTNLERWKDSADNYLRAADALSMDKDRAYGAACTYGFAAAAFIANKKIEKANLAIEHGRGILEMEEMDSKSRQRSSEILAFLTTICNEDLGKAEELWSSLERKIKHWMYPNPEEAYPLFKKALHARIKEIG